MNEYNTDRETNTPPADANDASNTSESATVTTWTESERPCVAVVEAIASATDRDPLDVSPLHYSVDADALDALVTSARRGTHPSLRLSFSHGGVAVVVDGDGEITVTPGSDDGE